MYCRFTYVDTSRPEKNQGVYKIIYVLLLQFLFYLSVIVREYANRGLFCMFAKDIQLE